MNRYIILLGLGIIILGFITNRFKLYFILERYDVYSKFDLDTPRFASVFEKILFLTGICIIVVDYLMLYFNIPRLDFLYSIILVLIPFVSLVVASMKCRIK